MLFLASQKGSMVTTIYRQIIVHPPPSPQPSLPFPIIPVKKSLTSS